MISNTCVECPGFATVSYDGSTGLTTTEFGSGTIIECVAEGKYSVFHKTGSCLRIDSDGTAVYYSCCRTCDGQPEVDKSHYYIMRHFDEVIAETIDSAGTHFCVTRSGENHVSLISETDVEPDPKCQPCESGGSREFWR